MDNGSGKLVQFCGAIALAMQHQPDLTVKGSGVFKIGEIVEIKGNSFRITNISAHKLTLTILKN
jgi:hypothetical protein